MSSTATITITCGSAPSATIEASVAKEAARVARQLIANALGSVHATNTVSSYTVA